MAVLIPNEIDQEDLRRGGERLVFEWLSEPNVPGTVFYSLLQKNHKHKLIGEIDFLYVCDRGLLCIEVKGGQEIYCKDKKWYSKNRLGVDNQIHNPFVQAKDCSYALKKYITDTYGFNSPQSKYLIGYAVVFPECKFTGSGNDLMTEVMFDARYSVEDFSKYLQSTFDFWEQLEIERHGYQPSKLTHQQINQMVNLLRGDFAVVPSMSLELQHINQKMLQLTEEQFDSLDITESNPRVIVQGYAGTGKSLLAIEKVRVCAAKEKRVLYLCFNKNMAAYAKSSLIDADLSYITVSTYHSLVMNALKDDSLYSCDLVQLSKLFSEKEPECTKYDYVVIDEAQDLMIAEVIDVISQFIVGGIDKGSWVMFLDPNQNIFNKNDEYDFALEYIRESGNPVIFPLNCNCRNTEQIARRTSVLTLVPPAKKLKIPGPKVVIRNYGSANDFIKNFRHEMASLLAGGVSAKDVVVLSKLKKEKSMLARIDSVCNLDIVESNSLSEIGKNNLNYYTIQSFKGLESNVVFLIDVDGFGNSKDRLLNYVAMSRAKLLLYVFYDKQAEDDYYETLDKGEDLLF